jgi:hypothetical protein
MRKRPDGLLFRLALWISAALALAACSAEHEPAEAAASPCQAGPSAPLGVACGEADAGLDASLRAQASASGQLSVDAAVSVDAEAGPPAFEAAVTPPPASGGLPGHDQPCQFRDEPGNAKIVAIEDPLRAASCKVPQKRVDYVFTPSAAGAPTSTGTIVISRGRDPPAACLAQEGLVVGNVLPATRKTAIAGNCSSSLDLGRRFESCVAACGDPSDDQ